ncbi:hypothetical protein JCGZ_02178 [Jatropha curcas]|uniref:Preprotein translocase subunit SECE1 n=1 Tax=Jatropha curcas TaxID=180498 RepID=A0A067L6Q9_JATCU|nr:preprotein translocase subunit SECE1 [Jatropha curcas]KDP40180.1 hypothetical protein JCGZ_02178 [Jatropha curcas]
MALPSLSPKLPHVVPPVATAQSNPSIQFKLPPFAGSSVLFHRKFAITNQKSGNGAFLRRAVGESQESTESEAAKEAQSSNESSGEVSELGAEIKKAMLERKKEEKQGDLLSGVAEEVQEIEWPAFGKVLGTTGVVLGVIAGSSVVLLTVNAVLAELSDRIFAGRGVQDFFG